MISSVKHPVKVNLKSTAWTHWDTKIVKAFRFFYMNLTRGFKHPLDQLV